MRNREASFCDIVRALKLDVESSCSKATKGYLSRCDDGLLILDNADDPDLCVAEYLPSGGRGTIIVTTRNRDNQVASAPGSGASHEVGEMKEDAVVLLLKTAEMAANTEHANRLVNELGFLALAIEQAITSRLVGCLQCYLEDYAKNRGRLLEVHGSAQISGIYQWTAQTTWRMSYGAVRSTSTLATSPLLHFSFLHYEEIPIELFRLASDGLRFKFYASPGSGISKLGVSFRT